MNLRLSTMISGRLDDKQRHDLCKGLAAMAKDPDALLALSYLLEDRVVHSIDPREGELPRQNERKAADMALAREIRHHLLRVAASGEPHLHDAMVYAAQIVGRQFGATDDNPAPPQSAPHRYEPPPARELGWDSARSAAKLSFSYKPIPGEHAYRFLFTYDNGISSEYTVKSTGSSTVHIERTDTMPIDGIEVDPREIRIIANSLREIMQ